MISYNSTVTDTAWQALGEWGFLVFPQARQGRVCTVKHIKSHPRVSQNLQKREENSFYSPPDNNGGANIRYLYDDMTNSCLEKALNADKRASEISCYSRNKSVGAQSALREF